MHSPCDVYVIIIHSYQPGPATIDIDQLPDLRSLASKKWPHKKKGGKKIDRDKLRMKSGKRGEKSEEKRN